MNWIRSKLPNCILIFLLSPPPVSLSPRQILYSIYSIYIYLVIIITQYMKVTIITGNTWKCRVASCWNSVFPYTNIRLKKMHKKIKARKKKKKKGQNIEKMTKNKNKIPKYAYSPWCFSFPFFLTPVSSSKLFVSISRSTLSSSFYCPVSFFFFCI